MANVKSPELNPTAGLDDQALDYALRPKSFDEYVGQAQIKENLRILIGAAQKRREPIEHILLHGPSGLGKTTLAYLIAKQLGANLRITSGTALEKAGDVGSILTSLNDGDVLFIDEVHRLNRAVEEVIYPAMENYKLDIVIGKGNTAKTLQIDLPRFTLVAATTKISSLSSPFRSRFGGNFRLDFYTPDDIIAILRRSSALLAMVVDVPALEIIARSSRFTPRTANRLLKRVRDFAQMKDLDRVTPEVARSGLALLEVDQQGLDDTDRKILRTIAEKFNGGPVGLKSIAAALAEEETTIEDVYEPYLLRLGFLARTSKGRVLTSAGYAHLGLTPRTINLEV